MSDQDIESQLRSVVISCLKNRFTSTSTSNVGQLIDDVARFAKNHNLSIRGHDPFKKPADTPSPHFVPLVCDIAWDLIIEGILRPGDGIAAPLKPLSNHEFPNFHVTPFGKLAISGAVTPFDPDGFLKAVTDAVPSVDADLFKYVAESAKALRANCLLSSTFTLGLASEKTLLMLVDSYAAALGPTDAGTFKAEIDAKWMIKAKYDIFEKWATTKLKPKMKSKKAPNGLIDQFDDAFHLMAPYFRDLRNTAGHPSATEFSRERVLSHLIVFPPYLRAMYDVIDWMNRNKSL